MHIKRLTLTNWGPYFGVHTIMLTDTVYAVQAAHDDDPERSNWIGKSWFLGAIRFLLTGDKPESCPNEDGWISWGEKFGAVEGVLSDGTVISRARKLGSSTQLEVTIKGKGVAKQDRAQEELYRLIGMTGEDLMATSFIEQRQIARLILADPSERTKIVNGWMELEPLQRAEAWLKVELTKLLDEERRYGEQTEGPATTRTQCEADIDQLDCTVQTSRAERTALIAQLGEITNWRMHAARAGRLPELQIRGKRTKAELDAIEVVPLEPLIKARETAAIAKSAASDREYQLRELNQGEWDGVCPKTCEACPVADHVRTIGASMAIELSEAESVLDDAAAVLDTRTEALTKAQRDARDAQQKTVDLERMRAEGRELLASVEVIEEKGPPPSDHELREKLAALDREIGEGERALARAGADLEALDKAEKAAVRVAKRREELAGLIRTHQEAIAVVGRQGAQKEIAEWVLSEIERGANLLLSTAGIDLTVEVSWAREGKGLATHCDTCGASFPKTLSQKVCAICGAARGPKLVEKLKIEPNDRSGAADDIAGLAFQLSASFWLRGKRCAPWAVACIDEPFGQLDRANSKALSARLHAMIRGSYAFEQGFLVAHDSSIMESLPAKVQIRGTPQGASLEVV